MGETELTEKVNSFLADVQNQTGKKIKNSDDISRLIEIIFNEKKESLLETLAFNSKYLQGLLKVVQTRDENISPDYFRKVTNEYSEYLQKIKNDLEYILATATEFYRVIFREKYFALSKESLQNLTDLCSDFALIKLFLNEKKRGERL
ncbi:MAG: hypothetical protein V1720_09920 [bacterium]